MHLSRLAEELVIWSSAQFRFVAVRPVLHRLLDHAAEEEPRRGRADPRQDRAHPGGERGALDGDEGPAAAYSKDMQEDKEQVFDAADTLMLALAAMDGMVRDMKANRDALARRRPPAFPPRPIWPTGWCANWTCRSATRIM
jgi:argininosuccinate lyase